MREARGGVRRGGKVGGVRGRGGRSLRGSSCLTQLKRLAGPRADRSRFGHRVFPKVADGHHGLASEVPGPPPDLGRGGRGVIAKK